MGGYELIFAELIASTDKAVLISPERTRDELWVPRSVIECGGTITEEGYESELYIKTWFCKKHGLI